VLLIAFANDLANIISLLRETRRKRTLVLSDPYLSPFPEGFSAGTLWALLFLYWRLTQPMNYWLIIHVGAFNCLLYAVG
jgi:hypothetical protein